MRSVIARASAALQKLMQASYESFQTARASPAKRVQETVLQIDGMLRSDLWRLRNVASFDDILGSCPGSFAAIEASRLARKLRCGRAMARITIRGGDIHRITLSGRVSASDLKRLERACGAALHQKLLPPELDLRKVSSLDEAAQLYLAKLRERGALVQGTPAVLKGDS